MTLRILLKRNLWDLVAHEILSLQDADGNRRISLGVNTSPWVVAYVSDHGSGAGAHRFGGDAVAYGCPSGAIYEAWWLVVKQPTTTSDGFFQVYRGGSLAYKNSREALFDVTIPAGTDMTWKGGDLMLRLGDPNTATMADYQVLDVCWWSAALSSAEVAAIGSRQLAGIADSQVSRLSDLFWYVRPSNTYADHIICEQGSSTGDPVLDATFAGDASYTVDTPRDPGWELPDSIVPPDPGPDPLAATATDSTITATIQPGSLRTVDRSLAVSGGDLWPYSRIVEQKFGSDGVAETSVDGLKPGTLYFVTGQWADASGNVATRQIPVWTSGPSLPTQGPTRSLHFTGGAEAVTALDAAGTKPLFVRMPYECDTTVRLLVRRGSNMTGPCWLFSQRADAAGAYGYARFAIGLDQYGRPIAKVSDGQQSFEANADEPVSDTAYDEVWMVFVAPTASTSGSVSLYKGTVLKTSVAIPAGTDFTWKKWDAQFVLGGYAAGYWNSTIDYQMLEPAWWTKALSPDEMAAINGKPLYSLSASVRQSSDLYWYARPHAVEGKVDPDLGASIGTAAMRELGSLTLNAGTIAPLITTVANGQLTYGYDVPPQFGGLTYTMADIVDALCIAAGLASPTDSIARLNVVRTDSSANAVDMADCIRLARIVAGLDSSQ